VGTPTYRLRPPAFRRQVALEIVRADPPAEQLGKTAAANIHRVGAELPAVVVPLFALGRDGKLPRSIVVQLAMDHVDRGALGDVKLLQLRLRDVESDHRRCRMSERQILRELAKCVLPACEEQADRQIFRDCRRGVASRDVVALLP
jgi:hypothetical protein